MDRIGRYQTERVLGTGAFGTVWLAHDETLDARVAIKVLAENWARNDSFRARFIEEARILWRADSDHVIRVHAVDELDDGRPYFVMDYADRGSLQDRMRARFDRGESFGVDEALAISVDVAEGLRVVHGLGIAHRDLKPANVMYRSAPVHAGGDTVERLVLVDFGIAKNLAGTGATTIATGTPHYMAPEQTEGRADRRSDVYSAAVVLYELLAGTVPYPYDSVGQLVRALATQSPAPLVSVRSDVPPALEATIARGLSFDPAARYADANEWLAALAGGAEAGRVADAPVAAAAPPPVDPGATIGPEELSARRRAAVPPAAAAAGAASAAGAVGASPPPPREPPTPSAPQPPPPRRPQRRKLLVSLLALLLLLAAWIGAIAATGSKQADGPNARTLFAEPISSLGQNAFSPPATPSVQTMSKVDPRLTGLVPAHGLPKWHLPKIDLSRFARGRLGVPELSGATPGLYGGTNLLSVCDAKRLVSFLEGNPDKARAWAGILGIATSDIASYVSGLTDVILREDTRVTNHGFDNGKATYINEVLQAGTAVLIDRFGLPVVRCKCGNPLSPPEPLAASPTIEGTQWPGFSLPQTVAIAPSPAPVRIFVTANVLTGQQLFRAPGSPATSATSTKPGTVTTTTRGRTTTTRPRVTTTTVAPTTAPPTTAPAQLVDVANQGTAQASSTFSSQYPVSAALDGDVATSWFSAGSNADGNTTTFTWTAPHDVHIRRIEIIGNEANSVSANRNGFGFNSVNLGVQNAAGTAVFSGSAAGPGSSSTDVSFNLDVVGRVVVLKLNGHESPDCGGFSELRVLT